MERKLKVIVPLLLAAAILALSACSDSIIEDIKEKIVEDQIAAGIDPFPDAPLVSAVITADAGELTNKSSLHIEIEFSEEIGSLSLAQLSCSNCTASDLFTEDNINFSLNIFPLQDGKVQMVIPVNTVESIATYKKNTESVFETVFDGTAPSMPVVTGITPTPNKRPTWSWSGSGEAGSVFRYKLGDSDFSSGATETAEDSYTPASDLAVTEWRLYVQERDAAGNWSPTGSFAIVIDTTSPDAPNFLNGVEDEYSNSQKPTWSWEQGVVNGNGTFRYKLDDADLEDGATVTTDTSFTPAANLTEGAHTLYIDECSAAGTWGGDASFTITVDISAPPEPVIILPTDADSIYNTSVNVTIHSDSIEAGCTIEYSWRQRTYGTSTWGSSTTGAYSSGVSFSGSSGSSIEYQITFTQTDPAGNTPASPSSASFVIDREPPSTPGITGFTNGQITGGSVSFDLTGIEDDGAGYFSINSGSPVKYTGTSITRSGSSGSVVTYSITVYQIDVAGNPSSVSSPVSFTIDRDPPDAPDVSGGSGENNTRPTWTWSSDTDGGGIGNFRMSLDGNAVIETTATSFTPPVDQELDEGNHILTVSECDAYGNWGPAGDDTIYVDIFPTGTLSIAESTTRDRIVTLNSYVPLATQMRFKNSEDSTYSGWTTYASSYDFSFEGADGTNQIDAQYIDADGNYLNLSDTVSYRPWWDDVGYDEIEGWDQTVTSYDYYFGYTYMGTVLDVGSAFVMSWYNISPNVGCRTKFQITNKTSDSTHVEYTVEIISYKTLVGGYSVTTNTTKTWSVNNNSSTYIDLYDGDTTASTTYGDIELYRDPNGWGIRTTNTGGATFDAWTPADP